MSQPELEQAALEISKVGRAMGKNHRQICDDICNYLGAADHAEADEWIRDAEARRGSA